MCLCVWLALNIFMKGNLLGKFVLQHINITLLWFQWCASSNEGDQMENNNNFLIYYSLSTQIVDFTLYKERSITKRNFHFSRLAHGGGVQMCQQKGRVILFCYHFLLFRSPVSCVEGKMIFYRNFSKGIIIIVISVRKR